MPAYKIDWHDRQWCIHGDDGAKLQTEQVKIFAPCELRNINGHGWLLVESGSLTEYPDSVEIYRAIE